MAANLTINLQKFLEGVANLINNAIRAATPRIKARVREQIIWLLSHSPEYIAIVSRQQLLGELGPVEGPEVIQRIVKRVSSGVQVSPPNVRPAGQNLTGGFTVQIVQVDYSELYGISGATFTSKGGTIPWLEWLLTGQPGLPIQNWHFLPIERAHKPEYSRTGLGLMVKSPKGWNIPSPYDRTGAEDNWITRALDGMGPMVVSITTEEVQAQL